MEKLEIQPVNTRIVCLNQPQLKHMWVIGSLTSQLGCFYNPHQPQLIDIKGTISLPSVRITKIKGHASQTMTTSESNEIVTNIQMGTYLVFSLPKNNEFKGSYHLVLNGIESILKGKQNPSQFALQLVSHQDSHNESTKENSRVLELCSLFNNNQISSDDQNIRHESITQTNKINESRISSVYPMTAAKVSYLDFNKLEEIRTLAEEELKVSSDNEDDDASDDIHQVIRRRLAINITDIVTEWEKIPNHNVLTLFLRPTQPQQAWQFLSSWISVTKEFCEEEDDRKTKRKGITRTKRISPTATLKKKPKVPGVTQL